MANVEREISRGGQYGAYPTATVFGGFPSSHAYMSREAFSVGQLRNFGGLTLLHWAIAGRCTVEVAEYVLSLGIDVNSKDRRDCSGATPLHFAAQLGLTELADLLIGKGADIEANSDSGTPLHWAISGPSPRHIVIVSDRYGAVTAVQSDGLIELNIPSGWIDDPIFESGLFKLSPRSGGGVMRRDSHSPGIPNVDTIFIAPAPGRNIETVELLIRRGASAKAVTPYGLSPLHLVSIPGCECETEGGILDRTCPSLALFLIAVGADINSVNEDGDTVLDLATCPRLRAELTNRGAQQGYSGEWSDDCGEDCEC